MMLVMVMDSLHEDQKEKSSQMKTKRLPVLDCLRMSMARGLDLYFDRGGHSSDLKYCNITGGPLNMEGCVILEKASL